MSDRRTKRMHVTRKNAARGGGAGGKRGGRGGGPKKPATRGRMARQPTPEREPTPVTEGNNNAAGSGTGVDLALKEAIAHEV
jgi:hypothetical protein